MNKISFSDLCDAFYKHNDSNNVTSQYEDKNCLYGVVVFKQGPWFKKEYTEVERSYRFSSDNKYFISGMGGNSIFASCLDGIEHGVRLDYYMGEWEIDYCYIEEKEDK